MHRALICGICMVTLFLGLFVAAGKEPYATTAPMSATSRYTDNVNGFSLDHPADWNEYPYPVDHGQTIFELTDSGANDPATIHIVMGRNNAARQTPKTLGDQLVKTIAKIGAKLDSDEQAKLGGLEARKICYTVPGNGKDDSTKYACWLACKDGGEIVVSVVTPGKKYDANLPVAEALVKSFRWSTYEPATRPA